jgi:TolB-like protein
MDINCNDPFIVDFITDELIKHVVKAKRLRIIDRNNIELILKEQHFQMSGVVDDKTAVSVGRLLGVTMIITGEVINNNKFHVLRLRILDVESAEIMASFNRPI